MTDDEGLVLGARENNAGIEGTLANQIAKILEKLPKSTFTEMLYYNDLLPEDALKKFVAEMEKNSKTSGFAWIETKNCRIAILAVRDDAVGNNTCGFMLWFGIEKTRIIFYLKNYTGMHLLNVPFDYSGSLPFAKANSIDDILFLADRNGKCMIDIQSPFMPLQMQNVYTVCHVSSVGSVNIFYAYGLETSGMVPKVAIGSRINGTWSGWSMVRE